MAKREGIGVSNLTDEIVHKLMAEERPKLCKNSLGGIGFRVENIPKNSIQHVCISCFMGCMSRLF